MDDQAQEITGIEAVKRALAANPPGRRSMSYLSVALGLSRGATAHWDQIPIEHVEAVSRVTGLAPKVLRPDMAELFSRDDAVPAPASGECT